MGLFGSAGGSGHSKGKAYEAPGVGGDAGRSKGSKGALHSVLPRRGSPKKSDMDVNVQKDRKPQDRGKTGTPTSSGDDGSDEQGPVVLVPNPRPSHLPHSGPFLLAEKEIPPPPVDDDGQEITLNAECSSVFSDLTENRTLKRAMDEYLSRNRQHQGERPASPNNSTIATNPPLPDFHRRRPSPREDDPRVVTSTFCGNALDDASPTSVLAHLFDSVCIHPGGSAAVNAKEKEQVKRNLSLTPEWGLAPSDDDFDRPPGRSTQQQQPQNPPSVHSYEFRQLGWGTQGPRITAVTPVVRTNATNESPSSATPPALALSAANQLTNPTSSPDTETVMAKLLEDDDDDDAHAEYFEINLNEYEEQHNQEHAVHPPSPSQDDVDDENGNASFRKRWKSKLGGLLRPSSKEEPKEPIRVVSSGSLGIVPRPPPYESWNLYEHDNSGDTDDIDANELLDELEATPLRNNTSTRNSPTKLNAPPTVNIDASPLSPVVECEEEKKEDECIVMTQKPSAVPSPTTKSLGNANKHSARKDKAPKRPPHVSQRSPNAANKPRLSSPNKAPSLQRVVSKMLLKTVKQARGNKRRTSNGPNAHGHSHGANRRPGHRESRAPDPTLHPPSAESNPMENRYKNLLNSFQRLRKTPLEPVQEETDSHEDDRKSEFKVTVPGHTGYLSDGDLIGDDILREDEGETSDEEYSYKSNDDTRTYDSLLGAKETEPVVGSNNSHFRNSASCLDSTSTLVQNETDDLKRAQDGPGLVQKSHSMKIPLNNSSSQGDMSSPFDDKDLRRQSSAPSVSGGTSDAVPSSATPKKIKPLWKAAQDPNTGRLYYYHRLTRTTTWTKPEEFDREQEMVAANRDLEAGKSSTPHERKTEEAADDVAGVGPGKTSPTDSDLQVWATKEKIVDILKNIVPTAELTVERLVTQYEGKEEQLLAQLQDLTDSRPFDEPLLTNVPISGQKSRIRSAKSGTSGTTKISDTTLLIKNTASAKQEQLGRRALASQMEESSHATSISTDFEENYHASGGNWRSVPKASSKDTPSLPEPPCPAIPQKIPVPRSRELTVEEFSSDRYKAETYDTKGVIRGSLRGRVNVPSTKAKTSDRALTLDRERPPSVQNDISPYHGDNEISDVDDSDTFSVPAADDSISALSEFDTDYSSIKDITDEARRRALNDAIAHEDWDLAAALSQGMKSVKSTTRRRAVPREWAQSELDRFISENDWEAVTNYIAQVRANNKNVERSHRLPNRPTEGGKTNRHFPGSSSSDSNPRKRFGARSQLQHAELHSVSSWESASTRSYSSEYTSAASWESDEDGRRIAFNSDKRYRNGDTKNSRRHKEFAC